MTWKGYVALGGIFALFAFLFWLLFEKTSEMNP